MILNSQLCPITGCEVRCEKVTKSLQTLENNTFFTRLCLYFYFVNRFICAIFLENKYVDTERGMRRGMNWETEVDIYTLMILCIK